MDDKKKAAALAAVMAYMRQEEDLVCAGISSGMSGQAEPKAPAAMPNIWALSGRQAQMQFRNLMQARAFHGSSGRGALR